MEGWKALGIHKPGIIGMEEYLEYSVIIPLIWREGQYHVLLEVRAETLKQPGEICLPGGSVEPGESMRQAAIRETSEELLIAESQIGILARLDTFLSPVNLFIAPFLAVLKDYTMTYSQAEVAEVFTVPLAYFLETEPELYRTVVKTFPEQGFPYHLLPQGQEYHFREGSYPVAFYRYEQRIIWGMTARILLSMSDIMKKCGMKPSDCRKKMAEEVQSG